MSSFYVACPTPSFLPDHTLLLALSSNEWISNLTTAEARIQDLENAISALLPGFDVDEVLSSCRRDDSQNLDRKASVSTRNATSSVVRQHKTESKEGSETLPRNVDGFDWTETAISVNEMSDGMAALAIDPQGAGYLGKSS